MFWRDLRFFQAGQEFLINVRFRESPRRPRRLSLVITLNKRRGDADKKEIISLKVKNFTIKIFFQSIFMYLEGV